MASELRLTRNERISLAIIQGENPVPSMFFDQYEGFVPKRAARVIDEKLVVRYGFDWRLWRYANGVYKPDGDQALRIITRELLDDRYRDKHGNEVLAWYRAYEPSIGLNEPQHLINCANGLIDWASLELLPHSPDVLSTVQIPVAWKPDAACPKIDVFLAEVLPGDAIGFA
jgi:putative DNA primase/helicase